MSTGPDDIPGLIIRPPAPPAPAILRWFDHERLDPDLEEVGEWFSELAARIVADLPDGAERATALRHLLHAKDAAVRAAVERRDGVAD